MMLVMLGMLKTSPALVLKNPLPPDSFPPWPSSTTPSFAGSLVLSSRQTQDSAGRPGMAPSKLWTNLGGSQPAGSFAFQLVSFQWSDFRMQPTKSASLSGDPKTGRPETTPRAKARAAARAEARGAAGSQPGAGRLGAEQAAAPGRQERAPGPERTARIDVASSICCRFPCFANFLGWEGSPTKIDRKQVGSLILISLLLPLLPSICCFIFPCWC